MLLREKLSNKIANSKNLARTNYYAAYACHILSVAASLAATIAVADGTYKKSITAVLAALPAGILLITDRFRFEARSNWWWKNYNKLDALRRELKPDGSNEAEISIKMDEFMEAHDKEWPGFGNTPRN
jgi:hypothetical protein